MFIRSTKYHVGGMRQDRQGLYVHGECLLGSDQADLGMAWGLGFLCREPPTARVLQRSGDSEMKTEKHE